MNATELHDLVRMEIRDQELPYLVDSPTVYTYIDAAQVEFCRRTEGIEDARTFGLSVVADTEWYDIDPKVLKLRRAYDTSTGRPVDVVNLERCEQKGIRFDGRKGPLKALIAGAEKNMVRAWPVPAEATQIQLEVFRLPKTVTEDRVRLEIDPQHHYYLLDWVKYLVFSTYDSDLTDRRAAETHHAKFMAYCARAKAEQGRARHSAGAVQYGEY